MINTRVIDSCSIQHRTIMEGPTKSKKNHFYIRHDIFPLEEDMRTEFKGHRAISVEEKNPWNFYHVK